MMIHSFQRWTLGLALLLATGMAGQPPVTAPWRSVLYPEDWTPEQSGPDGDFLHDFSYAGYARGERPIPEPESPVFDVVADFGADPSGETDATAALQAAIDAAAAAGGGVVWLPEGLYRCDAHLRVNASKIVIRGAGPERSRLFFTFVPRQEWTDHLQVYGQPRLGDDLPLAADGLNRALQVTVADAATLSEGDDVAIGWIITPEFIDEHQMTGTWRAFNDRWRPFFRRQITRIDRTVDPHRIELDVPLRYPATMRDGASIRKVTGYLEDCGIEHLGISNAVDRDGAWSRFGVHAIGLRGVKDGWVRNVASFPSPLPAAREHHLQNGGIIIQESKRVTVADSRMANPQNRGGGGSGYLFHISRSNEILTRDCVAIAGRHNYIQNWDFGASGLVWLRCVSRDGRALRSAGDRFGQVGYSEYHHSLAMACLVDSCELDDGWYGGNRHNWSSGAGITVTQSVYWNVSGKGVIRSWQFGRGQIIGTRDIRVQTGMLHPSAAGTQIEDRREGIGQGAGLLPQSLYEDQLRRRLKPPP